VLNPCSLEPFDRFAAAEFAAAIGSNTPDSFAELSFKLGYGFLCHPHHVRLGLHWCGKHNPAGVVLNLEHTYSIRPNASHTLAL
jgi:hypothetical protein